MQNTSTIECPNCKTKINIEDALYMQLQSKFDEDIKKQKDTYAKAQLELEKKEQTLKDQEEKFEEKLQDKLALQLKSREKELKVSLSKEIEKSQQEAQAILKKELEEKSKEVQEFYKTKAELEKVKREKDEVEAKTKAKIEKEMYDKLSQEKQKAIQEATSQNDLKLKEADEKYKQLQDQLKIAQRKAEQGSMQTQGEAQELAIEEYLSLKFPLDTIEEIKKGQRGADCLQLVNTNEIANCGKIYYESKRTKDFQKSWIAKFKDDMREKGADVGVLVTSVLPKELDRMGFYEGVWVCSFDEFKGSAALIRNSLIQVSLAKKSQEGKGDKMSLLYKYLTSNEFSMQIEAIVEGFSTMQGDLDKEKRAMAKLWKQREKQLEKVLDSTVGMYGSIKGIAGNAIEDIKVLELGYDDNSD
jgi:hypothetical protein